MVREIDGGSDGFDNGADWISAGSTAGGLGIPAWALERWLGAQFEGAAGRGTGDGNLGCLRRRSRQRGGGARVELQLPFLVLFFIYPFLLSFHLFSAVFFFFSGQERETGTP